MTDLSELIERVEKLTGPDREVDSYLHAMAVGGRVHSISDGETIIERPIDGFWIRNVLPLKSRKIAPYTASIDAAIALVEKCLPGWKWTMEGPHPDFRGVGPSASLWTRNPNVRISEAVSEDAPTPAIALVLALLCALQSQEAGNEG